MFSANQTISPNGLKTIVVAKRKGNRVGWGGEWSRTGPETGSDGGGMESDRAGNKVGWGGTGLDRVRNVVGQGRERGWTGPGMGSDKIGNRVGWRRMGSDRARNGVGRGGTEFSVNISLGGLMG